MPKCYDNLVLCMTNEIYMLNFVWIQNLSLVLYILSTNKVIHIMYHGVNIPN